MKSPNWRSQAIAVFCGMLLFSSIAFYNGFPLVTHDTGTYIGNGFIKEVPIDRPIAYCLFVSHSSLQTSLWLTVLAQALILALLLVRLNEIVLQRTLFWWQQVLIFVGLTAFTGVSWFISQLMPDIFAGLAGLTLILLLIDPGRHWIRMSLYGLCLIASMAMHSSILVSCLLFGLLLLGLSFFPFFQAHKKAMWLSASLCFSGWIFTPLLHLTYGGGFQVSQSSHVFLMAKFAENGTLKAILDRHCDEEDLVFCPYKDQLPKNVNDFLWTKESSFHKTGGWENSKAAYQKIIQFVWKDPVVLRHFLWISIMHTFQQLSLVEVGDGLFKYGNNTNPYWQIGYRYKLEFSAFQNAIQNRAGLEFSAINKRYNLTLWVSLLVLVLLFSPPLKLSEKQQQFLGIILIFILFNSIVCGSLANINGRFQSRLIWLLPYGVFLLAWGGYGKKIAALTGFENDS